MKKGVSMCFIIFRDVLPATGAPAIPSKTGSMGSSLNHLSCDQQTRKPQKSNGTQRSFSGAQNPKICLPFWHVSPSGNQPLLEMRVGRHCVAVRSSRGVKLSSPTPSRHSNFPAGTKWRAFTPLRTGAATGTVGSNINCLRPTWGCLLKSTTWDGKITCPASIGTTWQDWISGFSGKKMQETLTNHWRDPPNSPSNLRPRRQNGVAQQSEV